MPSSLKRKGRPKGTTKTTVIGLPKSSSKIVPFCKLPPYDKKKIILNWLSVPATVKMVLDEELYKLESVDIKDNPEIIDIAILDENVDINVIRTYLDEKAWKKLCRRRRKILVGNVVSVLIP